VIDPRGTLRTLSPAVRLGLSCLVLVMLGGLAASLRHMVDHHAGRDERPGLSLDDVRGAYHGVRTTAPLLVALQRDHPQDVSSEPAHQLTAAERDTLLKWLRGQRVSEDYDNLDLGDAAPAEIMAARCLACHSRRADAATRATPDLDYFDDVRQVAFSREINPTARAILTASTHAHALSLATLSIVVAMLLLATGWARPPVHGLIALMGVALAADLASWWLARPWAGFVWVIVLAGAVYHAATVAALLAVLVDLWLPSRRSSS
jgi:hypothetical protein